MVRYGLAPRARLTIGDGVDMSVVIGDTRRIRMDSPIGLAAGFDKNGVAVGGLFDLGFSAVEIGRLVIMYLSLFELIG